VTSVPVIRKNILSVVMKIVGAMTTWRQEFSQGWL
jgi:hypothetical protein